MEKTHLEILRVKNPQVAELLEREKERQMNGLELIPSENLVSGAVLEALGSVCTNKYSEGYPRKRYYGGNEVIDEIEELAILLAKELFNAPHVNVQSLSGSPANMAAYMALMELGDKLMAMRLDMGGHLSHGHKVNFSGKWYHVVHYPLDKETEMLDYEMIRKMAMEEKPKVLVSGYSAYPRAIDFKQFKEIADECGAYSMADIAHIAGLCCTGVHENPAPYFDVVTTTTHKTLRGPRGAMIMCKTELAEKIDKAVFPGLQGGPHEHQITAAAVAFREALQPDFTEYAKQIVKNAKALADELTSKGFRLVSGGTDNHLILIDLQNLNITGNEGANALEKAGIYCNKNTIPYDPRKPWDPSGIRIGTPTLTTRGMKESEMKVVADFMHRVLKDVNNENELKKVRAEVTELCKNFGFYT